MFEYKMVKVPIRKMFTTKKSSDKTVDKIKEIIDSYAKDGWRFVQIFAPIGEGLITPDHYQVILERKL